MKIERPVILDSTDTTEAIVFMENSKYHVSLDTKEASIEVSERIGKLLQIGLGIKKRSEGFSKRKLQLLEQKYKETDCHTSVLYVLDLMGGYKDWEDTYCIHVSTFKNEQKYENTKSLRAFIKDSFKDKMPTIGQILEVKPARFLPDKKSRSVVHSFIVLGFDNKDRCICIEKVGRGSMPVQIVEIEEIFNRRDLDGRFYRNDSWGFKSMKDVLTAQ